jgi:hypothetical protein
MSSLAPSEARDPAGIIPSYPGATSQEWKLMASAEQTSLSIWLRESDWGHPIALCAHAVGMGIVVGISIMFSARMLGYSKEFPLATFDKALIETCPVH